MFRDKKGVIMPINEYLKQVKKRYSDGISTEHSYRSDLQGLISELVKGITITNEPKRQKCGAPDYIIQRKEVPIGYIEAKDIGIVLSKEENSDQMTRYLKSLDNLILTDYLEFHFFKFGQKVKEIKIASIDDGTVITHPENFDSFTTYIQNFCEFTGQTIKSAEKLAELMAQKARMMEEVLYNSVKEDDENNTLKDQLKAFRQILIHDLTEKTFADIYAQTIAYGLFAARLHDTTLNDFTRQKARDLIPRSNPFLRSLFDYVSGADLDDRVIWIVNDLADIFRATDLKALLSDFGKSTGQEDPFIHFYETFLAEYDPALRKSRGVYYTPQPVVNFIVRAVDDILKEEFGLPTGLADNSKVKIRVEDHEIIPHKNMKSTPMKEIEVHKVQILDPAAGTGTFLTEVVRQIYKKFNGQEGLWNTYVEEHLIPRLNGFEILMAPYTMCHLKLEILLRDTGYKPREENKQKRLRVFLTNSLEEYHPETGTLFASWLAREATEANYVKRDTPVMVIIGNPPYSGESSNKGEWIMKLMEDYKKEPGGIDKLDEKNPKWINDDYVKFIRFGQYFIEKNGEGILGFINPHGFLDNPTFRGMRWNLLKTYDKIFTIDLHGNTKKKETAEDGSIDQNVFDIMQGVSINLFIKTGKKKINDLGKVYHFDLFGQREHKYNYLLVNNIKNVSYQVLENISPNFFFVRKDFDNQKLYYKGFSVVELFSINSVGIVSGNDSILINDKKEDLRNNIEDYYKIKSDNNLIKKISYRPFDSKYVYYDTNLVERTREKVMQHFLKGENLGLNWIRPMSSNYEFSIFISKYITDQCSAGNKSAGAGISYLAPTYLYAEDGALKTNREPNLNPEIVVQITTKLNLIFTPEKENVNKTFAPIDIIDYIYAILHSPTYREKYNEFLKIDFPRVPYPENIDTFRKLVKLGGDLRQIHLLESPVVNQLITSYPIKGNNRVEKVYYENVKVYINDIQYFDKVPDIAWEFYIGGYQPAQKWLKDRKDKELSFDDILHYQKIIVALTETDRIMKEIDKVVKF